MSDLSPAETAKHTKQRPRWWRSRAFVLTALAVLLIICGVAFWTGFSPKFPIGPVRLTRGSDGWQRQADDDKGGMHWEAQAAKLNAQNNLSSTASESRSGRARFACRRLVVFNRSDHPLMQRMGPCLLEELKTLKGFETIEYFPHGEHPQPGTMAPDICVTLDLDQIQESGLAARELEARIHLAASNTLMRCSSHYHDGLGPPEVEIEFDAMLDHRSTTTGIGSPSSRHKLAAADIGKQLGKALVKKLNDIYDKDGPLPELPASFFPAYRKPPALPLPEGESAEMVASHHGLMTANETLWRLETDRTVREVLTGLKDRLDAEGWKSGTLELSGTSIRHLRAFKDGDILTAYLERKRELPSPGVRMVMKEANAASDAKKKIAPEPTVVFIHYVDRMSRDELSVELDGLLDSDAPMAPLILFENNLCGDQRERLLERFKEQPPNSPDEWLVLAQLHKNAKRDDEAREALMQAVLLLRTIHDPSKLQGKIDDLAKKLGDKELPKLQPDPALLDELGFIELTPEAEIPARELGLDEPALFFGLTGDGNVKTITIRMVERTTDKGEQEYVLSHIDAEGQGRSWGTGGMTHYAQIDGVCQAVFRVEKIAEEPRFRLTTQVSAAARGE